MLHLAFHLKLPASCSVSLPVQLGMILNQTVMAVLLRVKIIDREELQGGSPGKWSSSSSLLLVAVFVMLYSLVFLQDTAISFKEGPSTQGCLSPEPAEQAGVSLF